MSALPVLMLLPVLGSLSGHGRGHAGRRGRGAGCCDEWSTVCGASLPNRKFGRRICQSAGSQEQGDLGY